MGKNLLAFSIIGLVELGSLIGCAKNDVSKIEENVILTKPCDCKEVMDIRYEIGDGENYQILCRDYEENKVLYSRNIVSDSWKKITVRKDNHECQE